MLIAKRRKDIAQIESEDVERVKDLRMGLRPSNVKYMRSADLAVERRSEVLGENGEVGSMAEDEGG